MLQFIRTILIQVVDKLFAALPSWLRYLYYMRFGLMIWVFPLVMVGLNKGGARSLTSGILVPETWQQYICVGFFILSTGITALVIARINVINGEDRFSLLSATELAAAGMGAPNGALPPALLKTLLNSDDSRFEILAVLIALVPTGLTFRYMVANSGQEGVPWHVSILGLLAGSILALLIWAALNVLYYLLYKIPGESKPDDGVQLGINAARTILFPRRLFGLPVQGEPMSMDTIEAATSTVDTGWLGRVAQSLSQAFVRRVGLPGYVYDKTGRIFESQFFALLAVIGFALTYLAIWPITAPVPTRFSLPAIALLILALIVILFGLLNARRGSDRKRPWQVWFAAIALTVFALAFPFFDYLSDSERFPVFASILIAVTMLAWILGGLGYFLDRFRVPVLTTILVLILVPRLWPGDHGREEHYLSIVTVGTPPTADAAPTPARILEKWLDSKAIDPEHPDRPVIIVTATGGGLHASAWTAAVLDQLEERFKNDPDFKEDGETLYSNILLISTVSGGSTGALSYLDERRAPPNAPRNALVSAACSSLEAVGWGIIYHDLPATLLPEAFWPGGSSSGIDDLATEPMVDKDRTWALRTGFQRNLRDTYCARQWNRSGTHVRLKNERDDIYEARKTENLLTLRTLAVDPRKTPALTMNTTTAEHGARFLLANYAIPRYPIGPDEALPAESFLKAFGTQNLSDNEIAKYADLPLATAAQLSATFPYVSSAARFPLGGTGRSSHFIDGGYYDNDGTASVLEFLRYAMDNPDNPNASTENDCRNAAALKKIDATFRAKGKHLRVVLIEIRNSADDPAEDLHADDQEHASKVPENLLFQLTAPLSGFWNAGHSSVTARNRAALNLIEKAYSDRLQIHHIVIADTAHNIGHENTDIVTRTDPLSWSLTPKQRDEIESSMKKQFATDKYDETIKWIKPANAGQTWDTLTPSVDPPKSPSTPNTSGASNLGTRP